MSFFDDLGKKVTDAGQSAIQKTKDMSDTVRLNSSISEEEKKIENVYMQIGKQYVAQHSADYEEEFAELFRMIADSSSKLGEYRKQLQNIKGVSRCPNCGQEVPSGNAFCIMCGTSMMEADTEVSEDMTRCGSCGAILKKEARFCTKCGNPVLQSVQN